MVTNQKISKSDFFITYGIHSLYINSLPSQLFMVSIICVGVQGNVYEHLIINLQIGIRKIYHQSQAILIVSYKEPLLCCKAYSVFLIWHSNLGFLLP